MLKGEQLRGTTGKKWFKKRFNEVKSLPTRLRVPHFPHIRQKAHSGKRRATRVNFEKSRVTTSFSRYSVNSACLESAQRMALCRAYDRKLSSYVETPSPRPSPSRGWTRSSRGVHGGALTFLARARRFCHFDWKTTGWAQGGERNRRGIENCCARTSARGLRVYFRAQRNTNAIVFDEQEEMEDCFSPFFPFFRGYLERYLNGGDI